MGTLLQTVIFGILNVFLWPSIICTLFLFYHFIRSPNLRHKPQNYILIVLLIINFIQVISELPFRLYFLIVGIVPFKIANFCKIWNWYKLTLDSLNLIFMSITIIDRYLLIFNHIFLSQHIFILRQFPLIFCSLFSIIFYFIGTFASSCSHIFIYTQINCGINCYFGDVLSALLVDKILFNIIPILIIIIFSILIYIRLLNQQHEEEEHRFYHENIQMFIQLLPLIILYLIIWIPISILSLYELFIQDSQQSFMYLFNNDYLGNLKYFINFLCPIFVLITEIDLHEEIKNFLHYFHPNRHNTNRIEPLSFT